MKKIIIKKVELKEKNTLDINKKIKWEEVEDLFIFSEDVYEQITINKTKYTKTNNNLKEYLSEVPMFGYKIRSGVTFAPMEIMQFEKDNKDEECLIYNYRKNLNFIKNLKNQKSKNLEFEESLFRPFVKAPILKNLQSLSNIEVGCIFPYLNEEIIKENILKDNYFQTWKFLNNYQIELSKINQREDGRLSQKEFFGVTRVGPYTHKNKHVLLRDNSKWVVTLCNKEISNVFGSDKYPLFDSHVKYISEICRYENHKKIIGYIESDEELYYVAGILSTDVVKDYMLLTNSGRGYSFDNLPFYLPYFDKDNQYHKNISNIISKNFDSDFVNTLEFKKILNNAYKELIENITGKKLSDYIPNNYN